MSSATVTEHYPEEVHRPPRSIRAVHGELRSLNASIGSLYGTVATIWTIAIIGVVVGSLQSVPSDVKGVVGGMTGIGSGLLLLFFMRFSGVMKSVVQAGEGITSNRATRGRSGRTSSGR